MEQSEQGKGIANLPYARGKTFLTLDEYLKHLEANGAIDLPYWRQISPGIYERVSGNMTNPKRVTATRAELMERFGFTR